MTRLGFGRGSDDGVGVKDDIKKNKRKTKKKQTEMFVACWEEQQVDLTVTALQTEVHTRAEEGGRRGGRELMVLIKKNSFKKKKRICNKNKNRQRG